MKKFISLLVCVVMICSLSTAVFAEDTQILKMEMLPDGRSVFNEDGERVTLAVWEDVMDEFHRLRHKVGVNWDYFDYEEMTFEYDSEGNVKALTQYMIDNDGGKIVTEDPNVVFIDSPTKFHATGAGEAKVVYYDAEGNEVAVSNIKVTGTSFSNFKLINECSKCLEDQGSNLHFMSCGHYSCEVGREGHGNAGCGTSGHYACDGGDHSICFNCRKGLCNGREHGVGVCPHVHNPVHFAWDKVPTCKEGGVERLICSGCGFGAIVKVPPTHYYNWFDQCVYCGQMRHQIMTQELLEKK